MSKAFGKIGESFSKAFKGKSSDVKVTSASLDSLTGEISEQKSELDKLKTKYKDLYLTQGKNSKEAKECAESIEKLSAELKQNENKLKTAERAADQLDRTQNDLDDSAGKAKKSVKDLGESAKNTEGGFSVMKGAISNVIASGLEKVIDLAAQAGRALIKFGKESVDAAAEVSAENSAFDQIMGDYAGTAQKKMQEVANSTGVVSTRLTGSMTSLTAKFKGLGFGVEDATDLAASGLSLASDAAAFWDVSLDESMGHLNSFINGSYEGGEAIGLFANDTQMASYAVEKGVISETKAWASLDEATKQATRLEYAQNMMQASGAVGQAAKESTQYANVQANLTEKWRQFKAEVGEPILEEFVNPAMQKLSEWADIARQKFQDIAPKISEFKDKLGEWWEKAQAVASFVQESFQPIMDALKGAWNDLKDAISPITEKLSGFSESGGAASTVMSLFAGACRAVADVINVISAIFTPVISVISETLSAHVPGWIEKFQGFGDKLDWLKPIIGLIGAAVATTVSEISGIINGFMGAIDGILQWIDGIFSFLQGLFDVFVGIFTGDTDMIKQGFSEMWNGILGIVSGMWNTVSGYLSGFMDGFKNTFKGIFDSASEKFSGIKETIGAVVDWLKGIFDFDWHLPDIKLPHFSIEGSFSLDPPSIPHIGVEWYAKGAVLNQPTIFGVNPSTGNAMIGGEAGAEAVAPIATLQGYVQEAVRAENAGVMELLSEILAAILDYFPQLVAVSGHDIKINGRTLAKLIATDMNRELGNLQSKARRGVT
jgi:phage-related protein